MVRTCLVVRLGFSESCTNGGQFRVIYIQLFTQIVYIVLENRVHGMLVLHKPLSWKSDPVLILKQLLFRLVVGVYVLAIFKIISGWVPPCAIVCIYVCWVVCAAFTAQAAPLTSSGLVRCEALLHFYGTSPLHWSGGGTDLWLHALMVTL